MPPRARSAALSPQDLDSIPLAPIVLVKGGEGYFVDRVTEHLTRLATELDPGVEVVRVEAGAYEPRMLDTWLSPSLFDERRHIVVGGVDAATDAFITDLLAYVDGLGAALEDVSIVLRHERGTRGKKLLDRIAKAGFPVVACDPLKKDADKAAFVSQYFASERRAIAKDAVRALVEATGSDLRELAAACRQLCDDVTGRITADVVLRYYGGRVEATGFRVADSAIGGDGAAAVTLVRHALATGMDPVPLVAVLGMKLRTLAGVSAMRSRGLTAGDLKLAPWQVDRARRDLNGWTPEGLARAITAVADADAAVKGESRDRGYAVERAVLDIAAARGRRG
ncbi:DNA polymerase III subunit delta [Pseudactinotalea sp. HY160]|uniref:DNA polymerase III subunit delta n=1 Tax=Pseudactinotalea sp. HY160 TaxID=2654490 RepID=UPI00128C8408|nr:DNA polymerase III subunit delta [Pseudactinotalea sp. HY160]MPV49749.1 DNA polymerase III subunit delta [Pseudactinotalea sp. HY160]